MPGDLTPRLRDLAGPRPRRLAAALVDRAAALPVRIGLLGGEEADRFEIGSITKALTGMLLADAIERGEVRLESRVGEILPETAAAPLGAVSLRELCTHTSGLPRLALGPLGLLRLAGFGLLGLDPYRGLTSEDLVRAASRPALNGRGQMVYSNLGGALLGHVLARRAGVEYPALLAGRLLAPCGLTSTAVAASGQAAPHGWSSAGLPRAAWQLGGYAPAGGVVSTIADMARLLERILAGTAPGLAALAPLSAEDPTSPRRSGMFWIIDRTASGVPMVWHNGATGGYSAFLAVYPTRGRGVVVLSSTADPTRTQRIALALAADDGAREPS